MIYDFQLKLSKNNLLYKIQTATERDYSYTILRLFRIHGHLMRLDTKHEKFELSMRWGRELGTPMISGLIQDTDMGCRIKANLHFSVLEAIVLYVIALLILYGIYKLLPFLFQVDGLYLLPVLLGVFLFFAYLQYRSYSIKKNLLHKVFFSIVRPCIVPLKNNKSYVA